MKLFRSKHVSKCGLSQEPCAVVSVENLNRDNSVDQNFSMSPVNLHWQLKWLRCKSGNKQQRQQQSLPNPWSEPLQDVTF